MLISKEFKAYIDMFTQMNSRYNTQAGALYQCCDATDEFIKFMHKTDISLIQRFGLHRFEFEIDECIGLCPKIYKTGVNEMGETRARWHCIVGTKNILIDWTARQYVESAPFPLILVKRGLHIRRHGGDLYRAIRLSHPNAADIREEVLFKQQQGYVWHDNIGWVLTLTRGAAAGA